jgi:oxygen-independent coproporphyrinogen-3 oxidase
MGASNVGERADRKGCAVGPRGLLAKRDKGVSGTQPVPRYTSYPTAPNFSSAVNADIHCGWLKALPGTAGISVYLHVPYCVELCHYCGCHTHATRRMEPVDRYVGDLITEIALVAKLSSAKKVRRIHWGGGTPTIVGPEGLRRIYRALTQHFDLSDLREHAIELDPRRINPEIAATLAEIGINRANFGVQEFSAEVQRCVGRVQPFEVVESAVNAMRVVGIDNLGIDLMYGLPKQTVADIQFSATLASRLRPQRVAIFGYAHVPWFKKQQRLIDLRTLPDSDERYCQALAAQSAWLDLGYTQVGIDHYVLPQDKLAVASRNGTLHRNFQGYTDDDCPALIALGASAISRFPGGYVQNHSATASYSAEVRHGKLATNRGATFSAEDALRAEIIERLMCDFWVDIDRLAAMHREPTIFSRELAKLDLFAARGLVRRRGRRIHVTDNGKPFTRLIASIFDSYLEANKTRHSAAI